MKIKISGLKNGTHTYKFEGKSESLDIIEPLNGNFWAEVVLNKFNDQIILEVSTIVEADFVCDRCSTDFKLDVRGEYRMVYLLRSIENDESELNITYLSPDTDKIDISNDLRDYLILSVPMKRLCDEECKGLCIKCGKNLNEGQCECKGEEIDDRWKTLLELKKKIKHKLKE
jgi:uncharacterized protein